MFFDQIECDKVLIKYSLIDTVPICVVVDSGGRGGAVKLNLKEAKLVLFSCVEKGFGQK